MIFLPGQSELLEVNRYYWLQDAGINERRYQMEEKVVTILNEMSEYLSVSQMKKLQEVILRVFSEKEEENRQHNM